MMNEPMEQYKPAEKLELKDLKKEFPKEFKKVCCPSCDGDVPADNLNLQNNMAKCGSCHVIFSIEDEVESVKTNKDIKQEIIRPEGIDLFYYKNDLDITVQQHIHGLDVFGLIIFPAFTFFAILLHLKKGIAILFPIILILPTLYFLYKALISSKNKAYIEINDKFLSVRSRPKNYTKDRMYAADEIDQLYLKQAADGSGYYTIFMIINSLKGQKHEQLITVNTLSKAKYLEQEIELYLGLTDRKVPEATA